MAFLTFLRRLAVQRALWGAAAVTAALVSVAGTVAWRVDPGQFGSALDGVWWAAATVTTVGYGDFAPESDAGRAIGFVLMFSGCALFAVVTAVIASVLVAREVEAEEEELESREEQILALLGVVDRRLRRLEHSRDGVSGERAEAGTRTPPPVER